MTEWSGGGAPNAEAFEVAKAIEALVGARRDRRRLDALPEGARPRTEAEAYAVQDGVAARLGRVGGWKVGAKGPASEPFRAPIMADALFPAGPVPAARFNLIGVEAELAYRFDRALPRRAEPYGVEEVSDAVGAVLPAIEVLDTRFAGLGTADALSHRADHQNGGALILGPPVSDWRGIDPPRQPVQLWIGGVLRHEGVGGNTAVDNLRLLVWLANGGAGAGGIAAGQVVTTGSCSGTDLVEPGTRVRAVFASLGDVEALIA